MGYKLIATKVPENGNYYQNNKSLKIEVPDKLDLALIKQANMLLREFVKVTNLEIDFYKKNAIVSEHNYFSILYLVQDYLDSQGLPLPAKYNKLVDMLENAIYFFTNIQYCKNIIKSIEQDLQDPNYKVRSKYFS